MIGKIIRKNNSLFAFIISDYPIERFRKYDPSADRSFIRFGRNPSSSSTFPLESFPFNSLTRALNSISSSGRLNSWWNANPYLQSKRPSPGELGKDTSFIRFGKRAADSELKSNIEPQF